MKPGDKHDLNEQLALLVAIVESSEDAIISKCLKGIVTSWNKAAEKMFGYTADEAVGTSILRIIPLDRHQEEEQILARINRGEKPDHFETRRLTKDGRQIEVSITASPIRNANGDVIGSSKMVRDITDRKRAEATRHATEERYRTLFEYAPAGILIADRHSNYLDANDKICKMLGYSRVELIGMHASQIVPPAEIPHIGGVLAIVNSKQDYYREWRLRRKDGSEFSADVIATTTPDGNLLGFVRDITEQRLLEQQFRQAQKMEAVGHLAGGVAHDFNNQITVVVGYAQLLRDSVAADPGALKMLDQIIEAGERSARLTEQLLAFSRKQVLSPKILDLNEVLVGAETLLRRIIGEDVNMVTVPHQGIGKVKADRGQLEQVLINLVCNARDAMPQGGKLTIETGSIELDDEYAKHHPYIQPGPYVMLAVTDSGVGMSRGVQLQIFEPFFTTKEPGKGTGLGLAMAYGVVKQSDGSIEVYSELGVGTCFKIYLPRVEDPAAAEVPQFGKVSSPRGTATILLVEDEAALRALASDVLRELGYHIIESRSSAEAMEIAFDHPSTIHLLLTDVVMPKMGGRLLAEQLVGARPDMKVLYMSGYTDDAVMRHGILHEQVNFLRKPFSTTALAQKVWEVLRRG